MQVTSRRWAVPTTPVLTWTWPQFLAAVVRQHGRPLAQYGRLPLWTPQVRSAGFTSSSSILQELSAAQGAIGFARRHGSFDKLSMIDVERIAGLGIADNRWLGYMGASGRWTQAVHERPAILDPCLSHVAGTPPSIAVPGLSLPNAGLVIQMHILTMTDPLHYFPVTRTTARRMNTPWGFGYYPSTLRRYADAWTRVRRAPWMTAASWVLPMAPYRRWSLPRRTRLCHVFRPPKQLPRRAWTVRAALLDALFYEP